MKRTQKVGAFIIRPSGTGSWDLLLFSHCDYLDAPIQIPGGTVEPDEPIEEALMREIEEESGLTDLKIDRKLGVSEVQSVMNKQEILERHCFLLKAPPSTLETWIHHVKGAGVDKDMRFEYRWHSISPDFTLTGDLGFFLLPKHIPEIYPNDSAMLRSRVLQDGEEVEVADNSQRWLGSWHLPDQAPQGHPHGALGICLTNLNEIVLVSRDGLTWSFPSGRPENAESWEDTLHREMMEEACAVVLHARLLGFSRGRCIEGTEKGLVLIRSIWLAQVTLLEWKPEFEISHRKTVPPEQAILEVNPPADQLPFWRRVFAEAKFPVPDSLSIT